MIPQLGDQPFRRHTFQVERLDVKPEIFVDPHQGAFGDELEVQGFHQFLKKHRREAFKAKREPHGLEFLFPIGSVHGRDAGGNMPFIIDVFKRVRLFRGKDLLLQNGEHLQNDRQASVMVLPCPAHASSERIFSRIQQIGCFKVLEDIDVLMEIFFVDELIEPDHQSGAFLFPGRNAADAR